MKDEASAVTDDVEMEGNVWSERRLNRREVTTWISVITFSGASTRARRMWCGDIRENTSETESNRTKYCSQ